MMAGIEPEVVRTTGPGSATGLAAAAADRGAGLVLVCGGDGTINEVVNGLARREVALGILPGGTANIIGKELGLPHNPRRAARELPTWRPRRIALGLATWPAAPSGSAAGQERRYFLSVAGIGFDAYIVHRLTWRFKLAMGVVAYGVEGVRQALRYRFPVFNCRIDGRDARATFAVAHRTRCYAGWLHLAPTANLFEDRLAVCVFKSPNRLRYVRYAVAVVLRRHLQLRDVELVDGRKVECAPAEKQSSIYFQLDGELAGQLPVTLEVVPDALTLLVPPSAET